MRLDSVLGIIIVMIIHRADVNLQLSECEIIEFGQILISDALRFSCESFSFLLLLHEMRFYDNRDILILYDSCPITLLRCIRMYYLRLQSIHPLFIRVRDAFRSKYGPSRRN